MNSELKEIIDENIEHLNIQLHDKLIEKISLQCLFDNINFFNLFPKRKGENKKEYIERICYEHPNKILNNLVHEIKTFEESIYLDILPLNMCNSNDNTIYIREKIHFERLRYLTEIKSFNCKIYSTNIHKTVDTNEKFKIESVNYFASEIILFGEFSLDTDLIDESKIMLNITYCGLKFIDYIPLWLESLLQGALYNEMNYINLAIFYYFVAVDSFIQNTYNQIHKIYNTKDFLIELDNEIYDYIMDNISDQLNILLYDELYDKYVNMNTFSENTINSYLLKRNIAYDSILTSDLLEDIFDEFLEDIVESVINDSNNINMKLWKESIFDEEVMSYYHKRLDQINDNLNYYTRQDKRLIKEKLKDIEHILDFDLNNKQFCGLSRLKNEIKRIEALRNNIAHGNNLHTQVKGNEFYSILTYILSIIFNQDLDKNCWDELWY